MGDGAQGVQVQPAWMEPTDLTADALDVAM